MILKTYPNKNIYGKYFLVTEAETPEDVEVTEDQEKPKRNVKVITVKPTNRSKDFTEIEDESMPEGEIVDEPVEEPQAEEQSVEQPTDVPEEAQPEPTQTEEEPSEQSSDTPEEVPTEEPQTDEQPVEQTGTEEPVVVDDATTEPTETSTPDADAPDTNSTEDFTNDTAEAQAEAVPNEGTNGSEAQPADGPDVGSAEDFTNGATQDGPPVDANGNVIADPNAQAAEAAPVRNAPGVELDSTRKYNLYKEYMSLYNSCDNYISKLENILRDDNEENQIIRISTNNLREIKDIISDYMTIRFQLNTYVQSLLFYQKMVVAVQLVFNLLKSINLKKH